MKTESIPDDLITLEEVALMTSLSRDYLYHIYKTQLPHFMFGQTVRFSRREIVNWIESKRVKEDKKIIASAINYCSTH